jgi:ATP-dependent Clp protease adaptor protein ClpS
MATITEVEEVTDIVTEDADEGRWTILVHNDDVTPYDFVIMVLRHIFKLSQEIAEHVTWEAHTKEIAPVCSRSKPEAERLIRDAHAAARKNGFPLTFTAEPKE